jgi:hypothetical protein
MKTILPNARFITLPSENSGRDWFEKSRQIDRQLAELSLDLAEETVYLLFDRSPGSILHGSGNCLVARSVIGPKRQLEGELGLQDWVQAPVHQYALKQIHHWEALLEECYQEWENLHRQALKLQAPFILAFKRQTEGQDGPLRLTAELLFWE